MPQVYPAGFNVEGFLRQAKVSFHRLQAANDAGDLRDISDYTTPELYAEIAMQLQERGAAKQRVEVLKLDAELVEVASEGDREIASVRFTGLIREDENAGAEPLDEVWHVVKDTKDPKGAWLIAGIQVAA
jgi:predicted lipid-binding transport protein (Tim44 family)